MIVNTHLHPTAEPRVAPDQAGLRPAPSSPERVPAGAKNAEPDSGTESVRTGREIAAAGPGPIRDAAAAEAFVQTARRIMQAQPGAAMVAQANAIPQSALRFLA